MNARVRFEPSGLELEVARGERVLDAADDHPEVGLPLSCRAGNCAACVVAVRSGAAALSAPATHERETLAAAGALATERLACQLEIGPVSESGDEVIVLVVTQRARKAEMP